MKVVIDTNIWISRLINREERIFFHELRKAEVIIYISHLFLEEMIVTATRPKFSRWFSQSDLFDFLKFLQFTAILQENILQKARFVDPKDEFLLDLSAASNADYLVTGDKALLELEQHEQTKIISLSQFKELLAI